MRNIEGEYRFSIVDEQHDECLPYSPLGLALRALWLPINKWWKFLLKSGKANYKLTLLLLEFFPDNFEFPFLTSFYFGWFSFL